MIVAQVKVQDGLTEPLGRFGAGAPKLLDQILKIVGYRYRTYIKKNYLSGQMLAQSTGGLVQSLAVGKRRGVNHVYLVGSKPVIDRQNLGGVRVSRANLGVVKLANIYEHVGGYVIEPKTAKRLFVATPSGIFFPLRVEGKERPFMSQSAATFGWAEAFDKTADEVIGKELKRLGFSA